MAAQEVYLPEISLPAVEPGGWLFSDQWYRFFETVYERVGGDTDKVEDTAASVQAIADGLEALNTTSIGGDDVDIAPAAAPLSDGDRAFTLKPTGVVADTYGDSSNTPVLTIDEKGRITEATTAPTGDGSFIINIAKASPGVLLVDENDNLISLGNSS